MKCSALIHLALLGAVVSFVSSCRSCRREPPRDILTFAGPDTRAALWVPDLAHLLENADAFAKRATRKAGSGFLDRIRQGIKTQFGVEPLEPKELQRIGLNTAGPLLLFADSGAREPLLVAPVADRKRFDAAVAKLLKIVDGADKVTQEEVHGFQVQRLGRPFGVQVVPVLAWTHVGEFAVLARHPSWEALVATLERISDTTQRNGEEGSLATDPLFQDLTAKLQPGEATVFARSPREGGPQVSRGAATRVRIGPSGWASETFVDLGVPGLAQALATQTPLPLATQVGPDAVFALLTRAAREDAVRALRSHPGASRLVDRALSPLGAAMGTDVEARVLPLLAGPLTLSVSVLDLGKLRTRLGAPRSLRELLRHFHVVLTAKVKDKEGMVHLLEQVKANLDRRGIPVKTRTLTLGNEQIRIYEPEGSAPAKLGWALHQDTYVYGSGMGRLERTLELLARGGESLQGKLPGSVAEDVGSKKPTSIAILRVEPLAAALLSAARQSTKDSVGVVAVLNSTAELLRTLGDVAAAMTADADGLRIQIRQQLE